MLVQLIILVLCFNVTRSSFRLLSIKKRVIKGVEYPIILVYDNIIETTHYYKNNDSFNFSAFNLRRPPISPLDLTISLLL